VLQEDLTDELTAAARSGLREELYRNSPPATAFLSGQGPTDLRPFLRFWDQLSYPAWEGLADALAHGPSQEIFELDDEKQEIASAGIEAILTGPANALAATVDLSAAPRSWRRTSGRTRPTPSRPSPRSWRASSPSTCATATSTASTKHVAGLRGPAGGSSTTVRSPAR
jgi:hypothetical protein